MEDVLKSNVVKRIKKVKSSLNVSESKSSVNEKIRLNDKKINLIINKYLNQYKPELKICDLDIVEEKETDEHIFDLILSSFIYNYPKEYKEYKKIINGRKLNLTDKKNIIVYLSRGKKTNKPFCLLTKKEKSNEVRKIVKRKIVKPQGELFEVFYTNLDKVKVKPYRCIPDEEYIKETRGDKRTKLDSFDKMSIDDKIKWARYSNLLLGKSKFNGVKLSDNIRDKIDEENIVWAMRYACKMTGKPLFQGRFKEAYWIFYRTMKYCYSMTKKESDLYLKVLKNRTKVFHILQKEI